jgi:hypothetical protein
MDMQTLKEKIDKLDPQAHKALRDVLTAEYNRLAGGKGQVKSEAQVVPDPFAEMFKKAVDELNRRYIEGTIDYIRKRHPDLYQKTNDAEDRLNEVWKAGLQGKAGIKKFRQTLKEVVSPCIFRGLKSTAKSRAGRGSDARWGEALLRQRL